MIGTLDITSILPPGIVRTRAIDDGLTAAWAANGYRPLSSAQILAVTGPAPAFPTLLCPDPDAPNGGDF